MSEISPFRVDLATGKTDLVSSADHPAPLPPLLRRLGFRLRSTRRWREGKDYERLSESAEAFIRMAMSCLLVRRLARARELSDGLEFSVVASRFHREFTACC
jgi:hypothetical protein